MFVIVFMCLPPVRIAAGFVLRAQCGAFANAKLFRVWLGGGGAKQLVLFDCRFVCMSL